MATEHAPSEYCGFDDDAGPVAGSMFGCCCAHDHDPDHDNDNDNDNDSDLRSTTGAPR